jgi:hypothetical protein
MLKLLKELCFKLAGWREQLAPHFRFHYWPVNNCFIIDWLPPRQSMQWTWRFVDRHVIRFWPIGKQENWTLSLNFLIKIDQISFIYFKLLKNVLIKKFHKPFISVRVWYFRYNTAAHVVNSTYSIDEYTSFRSLFEGHTRCINDKPATLLTLKLRSHGAGWIRPVSPCVHTGRMKRTKFQHSWPHEVETK